MAPDNIPRTRDVIPEAPPMRVWMLSLFLLVLCLSVLVFLEISEIKRADNRYVGNHQRRIHAFGQQAKAGSRPRVVIFGTSLLFRSTRAHNLGKMATEMGLERLRFLILARPMGNFYHYLPLVDSVLHLSPDLLLIESDLLFSIEYVHFLSRDFLRRLPRIISRRMRGAGGGADGRTRMQRNPERYLKLRQRAMRRRMALPAVRPGVIRKVVERLREAGVHVAVLDIPRAAPLEMEKNRQREHNHRKFMDFLRQECRITWLVYPNSMESSLFQDYSHLTPAGGRIFLEWLLPRIGELIKMGGPA